MDCCHTNWYLKKSYAQKPESRVNAFSDSIWINDVFYLETQRYDRDYHYMSFQRTPATETQFAAASKQNQQDWRETIKEPSNIQRVARNKTFWRLKSVTSRQKLRMCLLTSHWKAVWKLWASKTIQRLYALQPKQKRATKTLCNCRRGMLNSLELNLEFKLALLPACCPKPPSPMPPTTNISLPSKYCIS